MDMFGIGIETEWPTSKSIPIPIPMTPELSTASTIHSSERNSDSCSSYSRELVFRQGSRSCTLFSHMGLAEPSEFHADGYVVPYLEVAA